MDRIFISYRRIDSIHTTGRINDRLRGDFGVECVFTDVDNIPIGVDFRTHLDEEVSKCSVLLAIIGSGWLTVENEKNQRRLDQPLDHVRTEIESALNRDIRVVPVLVEGADMPAADDLPESIQDLAFRNGLSIRPDPDFHKDMDVLIRGLKEQLHLPEKEEKSREDAEAKRVPDNAQHRRRSAEQGRQRQADADETRELSIAERDRAADLAASANRKAKEQRKTGKPR